MKKRLLRVGALLLTVLMLMTSCAKLPKMKYENGIYTHPKTGVSYVPAPSYYQAIALDEDAEIARIVQKGIEDVVLYAVSGVDTKTMLTSDTYETFCAEGTTLPTLSQMKPEVAYVCQTIELTWALAEIRNAAELETLIGTVEEQKGFPAGEIDAMLSKEVYDLKFRSDAHPGLYYCVTYWQFESEVLIYEEIDSANDFPITYPNVEVTTELYKGDLYAVYHFGRGILYDRVTKCCYPAGEIVENYILDAE